MSTKHNLHSLLAINKAHESLKGRVFYILITLISLSFVCIFAALSLYLYTTKTLVPYVISIDKHGVVLAHDRLNKIDSIPESAIITEMCSFIRNLREVTADEDLQTRFILKAYSYVKSKVIYDEISSYFIENNPLIISSTSKKSVEIVNVLKSKNKTLQIDWVEKSVNLNDRKEDRKTMRALLCYEVDLNLQRDSSKILNNPLGIFVTELSISEIVGA